MAGLTCLFVLWFGLGVDRDFASGGLPDVPPIVNSVANETDSPSVVASNGGGVGPGFPSQGIDLPELPGVADAPRPAAVQPPTNTEPAFEPTESLPEVDGSYVPFLRSVVAALDPGSPRFGHFPGAGAFGGFGAGGAGFGGIGGGGGGPVADETDRQANAQFADSASERASLLSNRSEDAADEKNANAASNDGGSNSGGSNGGGSSNGNSGPSSNNGGSGNSGSGNGGSEEGAPKGGAPATTGSGGEGGNDGGPNEGAPFQPFGLVAPEGDGNPAPPSVNKVGPEDEPEQDRNPQEQVAALQVPEPGLMLLTGLGLSAAFGRRIRARRR